MNKKMEIDEAELLKQMEDAIIQNGKYFQIKITCPVIPQEVLNQFDDEATVPGTGLTSWKSFVSKVFDYVHDNIEYTPIVSAFGENVSVVDRAIASHLSFIFLDKYYNETLKEIRGMDERFKEEEEE